MRRPVEPGEPDWTLVLDELNRMTAGLVRQMVLNGELLAAAEFLVDPWTRCPCGLRFVAQVEQFLPPSDVRRLHQLSNWENDR